MLNAITRAAAGALRGVKASKTPQLLQNEATTIIGALTGTCEYKFYVDLLPRYYFLNYHLSLLQGYSGRPNAVLISNESICVVS